MIDNIILNGNLSKVGKIKTKSNNYKQQKVFNF